MVKLLQFHFGFEHAWSDVTLAFWLRYPNPFSSHVLAADVVSRRVDPETQYLHTTRLLLKRGVVPKWGQRFFRQNEAYILEESVVDAKGQRMVTRTRNLNHKKMMHVAETQRFNVDPRNPEWTRVTTEVKFESSVGWGLTGRIEGFGLSKFRDNAKRSREGMNLVLERLRSRGLRSFVPTPSLTESVL
ncbi:MAG: PRELI-like family-domain-containing protein [Piptocephalis tieghemiana]|nr:MAG: PRELI-like family-domain-containing protein [Piptocephalis tieghemiana]